MAALSPGMKAPFFNLHTSNNQRFSLEETLKQNPLVVLAFFKVSCPVCQLTFPYLERLHRNYPDLPIWGISQDDQDATTAFARMFGSNFPMLLDTNLATTVDYDLTNVPTIFVVDKNGNIKQTIIGFVKAELEALNETLANVSKTSTSNVTPQALFTAADQVPELKPG